MKEPRLVEARVAQEDFWRLWGLDGHDIGPKLEATFANDQRVVILAQDDYEELQRRASDSGW